MTIPPLKRGFTQDQFTKYVNIEVAPRMSAWRPRGVTLHNTYMPNLARVDEYLRTKKWTAEQLIDNWWQSYIRMKWNAGPHLFVFRDKIFVATPLWIRGTHSPSYNATHWGVELIGDYSKEVLPPELRANAVSAIADLYAMIGHAPNPDNFKYHGEDPRTSHKGCPGRNVGTKTSWLKSIQSAMADDGEHQLLTS